MGAFPSDLGEIQQIGPQTREWVVNDTVCPALRSVHIRMCGVSMANEDFRFVRHDWEFSQILLSLSPGGNVWTPDGWHALAPGERYMTPARTPHAYHGLPGVRWELVWAIFDEQAASRPLVAHDQPMVLKGDGHPLRDVLLNLHHETMDANEPAMVRLWVDLAAAQVHRQLSPARTDPRLAHLWEEVSTDLGYSWTLSDLARRAGLSPEMLRRLCGSQYGCSPIRHLTGLRMHRAAALLTNHAWNIVAIAAAVGYHDPYSFSTAFRRFHGVPPSSFRAKAGRDPAEPASEAHR